MNDDFQSAIMDLQRRDAQFTRCALQVNPFRYVSQYVSGSKFSKEDKYNSSMVKALQECGVGAIGITDHFRAKSADSLRKCASDAGITVFPGFEAVTREGVHLLCLFDPKETLYRIERYIGSCGVVDDEEESPVAKIGFDDLVRMCVEDWGGVCIAAHVCGSGGLLDVLKGKPAIGAWTNDR